MKEALEKLEECKALLEEAKDLLEAEEEDAVNLHDNQRANMSGDEARHLGHEIEYLSTRIRVMSGFIDVLAKREEKK